jgi:hypothetical protein
MIDVYASERHYIDHLAPVWKALPAKARGQFIVTNELNQMHAKLLGIDTYIADTRQQLTLVASYGDYRRTKGPVVYMEHGIGHSYSNDHPSYAGGIGKDRVVLFLCQHKLTAEKNKKAYPKIPTAIIGTPKLDTVKVRPAKGRTVAVSWHWDCKVAPETRSTLPHFKPILQILKNAPDITLIGHAHPRTTFNRSVQRIYSQMGIEYVHDFADVLDRADLYIIDNSSSAYEFAAAGRQVLHLNAPWYRKDVNHGIRFWDYLPGPTADKVTEVLPLVRKMLEQPELYEQQRKDVVRDLYPYQGKAAKRAAEEIKKILC